MRRQTEPGGGLSAGSSRDTRLDPYALPARFSARDDAADGRVRSVEIHPEQVIVRRVLNGMRMALRMPLRHYRGVVFRMRRIAPGEHLLSITLEHRDPALSVPLYGTSTSNDIVAEWQLWARVLRLPLLIEDGDGTLRAPFPCLGAVRLGAPSARRRRHSVLRKRRPRILMRRRLARSPLGLVIHDEEREIIARN